CDVLRRRFVVRHLCLRNGQAHDECRTLARPLALRFHAPDMQIDAPLHEREPEAQAPTRALEAAIGLAERLEDALEHRPLHPDARVADRDDRLVRRRLTLASHLDMAAWV